MIWQLKMMALLLHSENLAACDGLSIRLKKKPEWASNYNDTSIALVIAPLL